LILNYLVLIFTLTLSAYSQDTSYSLAFKRNRTDDKQPFFYRPDLSYQILQQFRLIQKANSGDPFAQHELGIRLLLGEGLSADTTLAVKWIKSAADKNLSSAEYNYAILLLNGIGVEWNPFEAYKYLKNSAYKEFPPAQYLTGLFFTDNLVVPIDWRKAYYWIYKSKQNGFNVEYDLLEFLEDKLPASFVDSIRKQQISFHSDKSVQFELLENSSKYFEQPLNDKVSLSFIDFESKITIDSLKLVSRLVKDIVNLNLFNDTSLTHCKDVSDLVSKIKLDELKYYSNYDVPEILSLLGYLYQNGILVERNDLIAAEYYLLAIRYDSQLAQIFLLELLDNNNFVQRLRKEIMAKNEVSKFVLYGLVNFRFFSDIILKDAYKLLEEASGNLHLSSINELALNYYTGNFYQKDINKAIQLWKLAESNGSVEATIRLLLSRIFNENENIDNKIISTLLSYEEKGSILSQVALGYCFEKGRGTKINKAQASKYYRKAAQRGNMFAYQRLKDLYNQIRPSSTEFKVN